MYQEIVCIIVFLAGLIFCMTMKSKDVHKSDTVQEGFSDKKEGFSVEDGGCPNLLLQKADGVYLYNNNKARIPGVNPIRFNNLDEYVQFMNWQRGVGIRCPVLYMQQTYDAQNNLGWRPLNSPFAPNAGMMTGLPPLPQVETLLYDANRLDPPFNQGDFPGYDPMNQYIGDYTPLDKIFNDPGVSDNPMNPNWNPFINYHLDQGYYLQQNRAAMSPSSDPINYQDESNYTFDDYNQRRDNSANRRRRRDRMNNGNKQYSSMGKYIRSQDRQARETQREQKRTTQQTNQK